jgi:hypothetical protein
MWHSHPVMSYTFFPYGQRRLFMRASGIQTALNQYLIESEDLYWKNWIGVQDEIDISSLYTKYREIFALETVLTAQNEMRSETDLERKRFKRAMFGQLVLGRMEYETREIQQQLLKKEAITSVEWERSMVPIRGLAVKILNEPDRHKRKEMIALKETAVEKELNPLRIQWIEKVFSCVDELGYENYINLCGEAQDRNFKSFAEEMRRFLDKSECVYVKYLNRFLQSEAGVPLDENSHEADLSAVFRCNRFDAHFPSADLLSVVTSTISGMGFDFSTVHLDLENRPKKKPRACVSAVNPPGDVRLTIFPAGGYDDYAGFLHESGHAIHFTNERPDLDFIYKYWGDRGFTEGTAYLFQHITMNPEWLTIMIGMKDPLEFVKFNAFMNILRFRRLIAQILYQLDLFAGKSTIGMPEVYRGYMEQAHRVKYEKSGYLNFDTEFYSAGYLRARMFESQLRAFIAGHFGECWWKNPDVGKFLKPLYQDGRKSRADEAVVRLGASGLDCDAYLQDQLRFLD